MHPKRRGMIDPSRRFVLQDLQNECVWFFSAEQVRELLLRIDTEEKPKQEKRGKP